MRQTNGANVSTPTKNPHNPDIPEWQLWENHRAQDFLCITYTTDIERYEKLRAAAFAKRDAYASALKTLGTP